MIRDLLRLGRPRVGLLATGAALVGGLLVPAPAWPELVGGLGGVFLLAAGGSALNQIQERRLDALMMRTADRPLPAGRLRPGQALGLALAALAGAALCFAHAARPDALLALAGLVLVLYNGLYTPLKRITPFCLLVGGAAGALPPAFGWLAAGGDLAGGPDGRLLALTAALYFWQIPHFWLFALRHRTDYASAGFPAPAALGLTAPRPPAAAWLLAYAAAMLMPAVITPGAPGPLDLTPALAAALLALAGARRWRDGRGFGLVNASLALFLAGLAAQALIGPPA